MTHLGLEVLYHFLHTKGCIGKQANVVFNTTAFGGNEV